MGVKLTWTEVGTTHLARRPLTGAARNTPGSTPRRLAAAFGALGESLGAQEPHLPHPLTLCESLSAQELHLPH